MQQVASQHQAFQRAMKFRIMIYENCCFEASKSAELIIQLKETAITCLHTPPQIIFILSRPYNCSCTADSHYSPNMVKQRRELYRTHSTEILLPERLRSRPLSSALCSDLSPPMMHSVNKITLVVHKPSHSSTPERPEDPSACNTTKGSLQNIKRKWPLTLPSLQIFNTVDSERSFITLLGAIYEDYKKK